MNVPQIFEKHHDEYGEFNRIPECAKLHRRPDICALLYIDQRFGGDDDIIDCAEHDEYFIDCDCSLLTEEDVIYLCRCGFGYDSENDSLYSFV